MKIKHRLSLGLFFLFSVITFLIVLGSAYILKLASESEKVLKNYKSLEYAEEMLIALDGNNVTSFEKSLILQEGNMMEKKEDSLTSQLRVEFANWKKNIIDSSSFPLLRKSLHQMVEGYQRAIVRKSYLAQETAKDAILWIGLVGAICFIISFTLIVNLPGYIADPISQLTESLKAIANRKYEERLNFESKDEYGELAEAFNAMSSKLEEYETGYAAKLLSEKKRIETLINRIPNPIIGFDENSVILFMNKDAEEIFGVKASELTGKKLIEVAAANELLRTLTRNLDSQTKDTAPLKTFSRGKESSYTKEIIRLTTGEKDEGFIGHIILLTMC